MTKFKADDDRQLMKCIDKFISEELKDKDIREVMVEDLDFKKFDLKNERLKTMNKELLKLRCDLFLKFTKQFIGASSQVELSGKVKPGSLTYHFLKNKNLALTAAKDKILKQKLEEIGEGHRISLQVNRNRAQVFGDEKKVDHDGTMSIFGQIFQACRDNDPAYGMFRRMTSDA